MNKQYLWLAVILATATGCPGVPGKVETTSNYATVEQREYQQLVDILDDATWKVSEKTVQQLAAWVNSLSALSHSAADVYKSTAGKKLEKRQEAETQYALKLLGEGMRKFFERKVELEVLAPRWTMVSNPNDAYRFDYDLGFRVKDLNTRTELNAPAIAKLVGDHYASLKNTYLNFSRLDGVSALFPPVTAADNAPTIKLVAHDKLQDTFQGCVDKMAKYAEFNPLEKDSYSRPASYDRNCLRAAFAYCGHQVNLECINDVLLKASSRNKDNVIACSTFTDTISDATQETTRTFNGQADWVSQLGSCESTQPILAK